MKAFGGGAVKSVQRGKYSYLTSSTGKFPISPVNPDKAVLFTGNTVTSGFQTKYIISAELSATGDEVHCKRAISYTQTIYWQVIEYV